MARLPEDITGPFSSLFDYDKELKTVEEKKQKMQDAERKIARANVMGEAFRVLVDSVGGAHNASITPRPVNPGILKSADMYRYYDQQAEGEKRQLRLSDLAAKEKDLGLNIQLAMADKSAEREAVRQGRQYQFEAGKQKQQQEFTAGENALNRQSWEKTAAINASAGIAEQKLRNEGDLKEIQARQDLKTGLASKGLFTVSRYDIPSQDAVISRNQVIASLPELKQWLFSRGVYPSRMPRALQINEVRGKISDDDLKFLIGAYPDFYQDKLPELTGGASKNAGDIDYLGMMYERITNDFINNSLPINEIKKGIQSKSPAPAQQNTGFSITNDDKSAIQTVLGTDGYSKEQKRSAIYSYLTKNGYKPDNAKAFAEYVYSNMN